LTLFFKQVFSFFYYLTIEDNNAIFSADILQSIIKNSYKFSDMAKTFLPSDRKSQMATSGSAP